MNKEIIIKNKKIKFILNKDVFEPNLTTKLLMESLKIKKTSKILELGCGCGIISLFILKNYNLKNKLHVSDLSFNAIKNTIQNLKKYKNKYICLQSDLFEKWNNNQYDIIIDDVSAISKKLLKISPWFNKIPCDSSNDGSALTIKFLKKAKNYLKRNGKIYFPVISLSNSKKILFFAKKNFKNLKLEKSLDWPLPYTMMKHIKFLKKLEKSKYISLNIKYGQILANTSIYSAAKK